MVDDPFYLKTEKTGVEYHKIWNSVFVIGEGADAFWARIKENKRLVKAFYNELENLLRPQP